MNRLLPLWLLAVSMLLAGCAIGSTAGDEAADEADPRGQQQLANGPIPRPGMLQLRLAEQADPVTIAFEKAPKSGLLFDLDTGDVLWRRDPARKLPIASLTKIMTGLVVTEALPDGTKVPITAEALNYTGSGVGVLPKGKWIGVSAMLHGLMLPSGNDAAIALAQRTAGSVPEFVRAMNFRAEAMGLTCTRYAGPSGIVDKGNRSCAGDLAVQARALLDEPRLAAIVKRRTAVLPFPIKGGKLHLANHNPLLRENYPGTIGIKTGYTDAAGRCIVAAVERDGRRLGVVLLDSPDPGKQAMQLLDRGFALSRDGG